MKPDCPPDEVLAAWLEGGAVEAHWASHLGSCPTCQALRQGVAALARVETPQLEAQVQRVLERTAPRARPWRLLVAAGLAVSLGVGGVVALHGQDELVPRGTPSGEDWLRRQVSAEARLGSSPQAPLQPGAQIARTEGWLAVTGNGDLRRSAYALIFLVDSAGAVHWIAPTHERDDLDEGAVLLAPGQPHRAAPELVRFDDLAPGPARLVSVVTTSLSTVGAVERLERPTLQAITARFPQGRVEQVLVELTP